MRRFFNNHSGFTIVEVVIAAALVGGVVLLVFQFEKNVKTQLVNIGEQSDIIFDQAGALRAINDDLSFSDPSFNYVRNNLGNSQADDFFTITELDKGERVLELQSVSPSSCIKFFSIDKSKTLNTVSGTIMRKNSLLITPNYFYNPRSIMTAPLVYNATKLNSLLSSNQLLIPGQFIKVSGMGPTFVSSPGGGYYTDYSLLFKIGNTSSIDTVNSSASPVSFYLNSSEGLCTQNNSSFDQYLRCLPTPGGGSTNFYITPVIPITYCLKAAAAGERGFQLYRSKGNTNLLIASNVEYLKLSRKKSNNPIINVDLKFCSLKAKSGICK